MDTSIQHREPAHEPRWCRAATSRGFRSTPRARQGRVVLRLPGRWPSRGKKPTSRARGSDLPRRHRAEDTDRPEPARQRRGRRAESGEQVPPRAPQRGRHRDIDPGTNSHLQQVHAGGLETRGKPAQPAAHRRRRRSQPLPDRPVTGSAGPGRHRGADHVGGIRQRSNTVTGRSTCVTRHEAHRARRGRSTSATPCTSRARAQPHGRSDSSHPGHVSWPLANLASTRTGSTSTVTNGASVHQHGPPVAVLHDIKREGRCRLRPQDSSQARQLDGADHEPERQREDQPILGSVTDAPATIIGVRNAAQQTGT